MHRTTGVRTPRIRALGWVETIDAPCWVTGPDGTLLSINARARSLLGQRGEECVGSPCHRVFGGLDGEGNPFCASACPLRLRADHGLPNPPVVFSVPADRGARMDLLVWVAAVHTGKGRAPCLAHIAIPRTRETRLEKYLAQVAARTPGVDPDDGISHLTAREREILGFLAADLTLRAVALRLGTSYVTVRNHVQHILTKLDAHSIAEAVARWLLRG
ncbi:MAG: hypothetical protein IPK72_23290 [Candidatus Eisenbacteria bacterium]|nr:hypothetical protein [Candidatus Eisenbacteria bacterium]